MVTRGCKQNGLYTSPNTVIISYSNQWNVTNSHGQRRKIKSNNIICMASGELISWLSNMTTSIFLQNALIYPQHQHRFVKQSQWKYSNGDIFQPVVLVVQALDTSQAIWVHRRGMAFLATTTHLICPVKTILHVIIQIRHIIDRYNCRQLEKCWRKMTKNCI